MFFKFLWRILLIYTTNRQARNTNKMYNVKKDDIYMNDKYLIYEYQLYFWTLGSFIKHDTAA